MKTQKLHVHVPDIRTYLKDTENIFIGGNQEKQISTLANLFVMGSRNGILLDIMFLTLHIIHNYYMTI